MDYRDGICQESQNRSTDIGRGAIYLSDLNDQALDYKKKKKSRTHSHTGPAIQTYTVLSVCDQEKQNYVQKQIRLSLLMTLYCINQAGSCL